MSSLDNSHTETLTLVILDRSRTGAQLVDATHCFISASLSVCWRRVDVDCDPGRGHAVFEEVCQSQRISAAGVGQDKVVACSDSCIESALVVFEEYFLRDLDVARDESCTWSWTPHSWLRLRQFCIRAIHLDRY